MAQSDGGKVFGFPLRGFGLFTSLLLAFAAAYFTFFASTTVAIFALLGWNLFGHHAVSYADSYRYVGFPRACWCWPWRYRPLPCCGSGASWGNSFDFRSPPSTGRKCGNKAKISTSYSSIRTGNGYAFLRFRCLPGWAMRRCYREQTSTNLRGMFPPFEDDPMSCRQIRCNRRAQRPNC